MLEILIQIGNNLFMNKYQNSDESSYILGISLTIEALNKIPQYMEKVYVSKKATKNDQFNKLVSLCNNLNIPLIEDDNIINKLSVKENCYGIGFFKKYTHKIEGDKHIVLYNFSNQGELGTIFRSAVSFDFHDVILINSNIDYFDPKVIRASMGSIFHLNIKEYSDFDSYYKDYKYNLYPFCGNGNIELNDLKLKSPYSIIIPQNYHDLDNIFSSAYYLKHQGFDSISLSSLSAIVLNHCYLLNLKR